MFRQFAATTAAVIAVAGGFSPMRASAQQEFVRQRLLVHNFDAGRGNLGSRVADAVNGAIDRRAPKDDPILVDRWPVLQELQKAGFNIDSVLIGAEIRDITRRHRADEYVVGTVVASPTRSYRLEGALKLTRDSSLNQPITTTEFPNVDRAAEAFGAEVVQARRQLAHLRRCENAMRASNPKAAAAAALDGIAAYPRAAVARTCLLRAYAAQGVSSDSMVSVALGLTAIDSTSWVGWEFAAMAYDDLGRTDLAGLAWSRVANLQANDAEVIGRVVSALMRGGNSRTAKPIISKAAVERPDNEHLAGLHWRVLLATEDWEEATRVGLALRKLSANYETQPDFFARMATAYRNAKLPFKALSIAAEGVSLHPNDPDLYLLYSQIVLGESDTVMTRGVELFPGSGKILAYDAQLRRRRGDNAGALEATRRAIAQDPSIQRGFLQLAQAFMDLKLPDSALVALMTGMKTAADTVVVAQFALARGNELYRAANGSKKREDFEMALRFLQFSGKLVPSTNAGFLMGSAAFGVAQVAVTELQTPARSCAIATIAQDNLILAETELMRNGAVAPDATKQFLDYASQMRPYVTQQASTLCPARGS